MSQATVNQLTMPGAIDPWSLPSFSLGEQLPDEQGIYFVLHRSEILYIGMTNSFLKRWEKHHRFDELSEIEAARIACCPIKCDRATLHQIERKLICQLNPVLNGKKVTRKSQKKNALAALNSPPVRTGCPGERTIMLDWDDIYVKTNDITYAEILDGELFSRVEVKAIIEDRYDWASRFAESRHLLLQER